MANVSGKIFELNRTALKQYHPDLLTFADNVEISSDYQVIEAKSNTPNLKVKTEKGVKRR